jgi:hypothetical protein
MWGDSPLGEPPDDGADAYDAAIRMAWERLYEQAPEGVGWEIECDDQDHNGAFVFIFRDAGGYEFRTVCDPWPDPDEEPY